MFKLHEKNSRVIAPSLLFANHDAIFSIKRSIHSFDLLLFREKFQTVSLLIKFKILAANLKSYVSKKIAQAIWVCLDITQNVVNGSTRAMGRDAVQTILIAVTSKIGHYVQETPTFTESGVRPYIIITATYPWTVIDVAATRRYQRDYGNDNQLSNGWRSVPKRPKLS